MHLYIRAGRTLGIAGQAVEMRVRKPATRGRKVRIAVRPERPAAFTLALRIPGWCRGAALKVNGAPPAVGRIVKRGYAHITRRWASGDVVELTLPMPVERVEANPKLRADCGRVALQRGPVVYCLEEMDNGADLSDITLLPNPALRVTFDSRLLGGVPVISARATRRELSGWDGSLYRPAGSRNKAVTVRAVPYCLWNNRKPGEMLVWIRR